MSTKSPRFTSEVSIDERWDIESGADWHWFARMRANETESVACEGRITSSSVSLRIGPEHPEALSSQLS